MDTDTMIRVLERVEEKYKHYKVFTGQLNVAQMAHDIRKQLEELKPYEDTGLDPEQIRELKEPILKLQEHFGNTLTVNQVVDFFVDFYIAQGDTDRVEEAVLLTNEAVSKYKELKERDTAKVPDYEGDGYADGQMVYDTWICPNCGEHYEVDYDDYDFCPKCGQRIKKHMDVNEKRFEEHETQWKRSFMKRFERRM